MNKFNFNKLLRSSSDSQVHQVHRRSTILERVREPSLLKGSEDSYVQLRPERWSEIKPANFLGPNLKNLTKFEAYSRSKFRVPEITLSHYHDAFVLPHYTIVTKDGKVSQDGYEEYTKQEDKAWFSEKTSFEDNGEVCCIPRSQLSPHWVGGNQFDYSYSDNLEIEEVEVPTLYLMAWHHNNVSHWFMDILSRIWGKSFIPEKRMKIIVPAPLQDYMVECLHFMGFDDEDIILAAKNKVYKFKSLYCVSRLASQYNYISPECTDFYTYFKNYLPEYVEGKEKKIYLSRRDANKRRCINEEKLESILKEKGFSIVQTTRLTLTERVSLFSGCDFLVGACGAGLFHSVFMGAKTKVLVTGTPEMHKNSCAFQYIGTPKEQDVYIYAGKNIDNKDTTTDNWEVDLDLLVDSIDAAARY